MEELLTLTTQEQAKALMHPLRQQILNQLLYGPATPSDVAKAIGLPANKVHYHVRILEKAGLVRLLETRTVGIVTEHFFERTARQYSIQIRDPQGNIDLASTMPLFQEVLHDVLHDAHALINQGEPAMKAAHMLMSIQPVPANPAERQNLEAITQRLLENFDASVESTPDQEYWFVTAWVPRQRRQPLTEEDE